MAGVNDFEVGKRYLVCVRQRSTTSREMMEGRKTYDEIEIVEKSWSKKYVCLVFAGCKSTYWFDCKDIEYIEELPNQSTEADVK